MANGEVRCIDSELPFETPSSWEWCRIFQIGSSQLGKTLDRGKEQGDEYPYLCSINVYWDGVDLSKVKTFKLQDNELERYKVCKGDLLICEGGDYGRCAVWDREDEMYYQNALHRVRFFYNISPYFYKYVIELYRNIGYIVGQGQTIKHFTYENMKSLLFPLPPLNEQQNVVKKIDSVLSLTKNYTISQNALEKLNDEIFIRLKQSILQEAIQGHLVSQDPAEEPAEELLKRIHKEKERLVTEGKLKRKDVVESNIFKGEDNKYYEKCGEDLTCIDKEIPFEIPTSWLWCRLQSLVAILDGYRKPISKEARKHGEYPYYGANGILDYVNDYIFDGEYLLVGEDGSVVSPNGNPIVNKVSGKIWVNNHAHVLQEYGKLGYYEYLFYALSTIKITQYIHGFMPKYSQGDLRKTLIPVPPLAEQQRILLKIAQALASIMSR